MMAGFRPVARFSRYALVLLFVGAGTLHFLAPQPYLRIMPPQLPAPLLLVYVSGTLEIGLGLLLLPRRTRRLASWGLVALLLAVFPANIYMAVAHEAMHVPAWLAWGRLPLQALLIWWVLAVGNWRGGPDEKGRRREPEPPGTYLS